MGTQKNRLNETVYLTKECDFKLSNSEEPDEMLQNVNFQCTVGQKELLMVQSIYDSIWK